ncbi:glycosyltransferase family 87 protein [Alicyclobacillus cycloheptanicus]|nr:glycosyltransferase family 87 protein [Alicyclobacillus cycloheptanicus]
MKRRPARLHDPRPHDPRPHNPRPHNPRLQQTLFCVCAALYIACVTYGFHADESLRIGSSLHLDRSAAALTDALPWGLACALAFLLSRLVTAFRCRWVQFALPAGIGLCVAVWLALQPIALSMDVLRYLWDGRLMTHGINPYAYVPADPHLAALQHWRYWGSMNWKQWPEAYPPLAQLYFGAIALVTNGTVRAYKLVLILNGIVSAALFYRVLRARQPAAFATDRRVVHQFALFALFPPLLVETYGGGHVDALAIPWMLLAWLWTLQHKPGRMGFAIAMAAAIKLYPVVLFAALWDIRRKRDVAKSLAAFFVTWTVLCLPFLGAGRGLIAYFHDVGAIPYDGSISIVLTNWIGPWFLHHATDFVFLGVCGAWALALLTKARHLPLERKASLLGLTFLLASPLFHPWYLVSLLPFAIGGGEMAALWLAVASHWVYDEIDQELLIQYLPTYAWYIAGWVGARRPDRTRPQVDVTL